jgi:hypothetical protein
MTTPTEADINDAGDAFTNMVYAALMEGGRPDLAVNVLVFVEDDGTPYVEPMDELTGIDLAIVEKAESLALEAYERQRNRKALRESTT